MGIAILDAHARLTDKSAMAKLVESIPHAEELIEAVKTGTGAARYWDNETKKEFWISSDGEIVSCLTFVGLTKKQAKKLRANFDKAVSKGAEPTLTLVHKALEKVTSGKVVEVAGRLH